MENWTDVKSGMLLAIIINRHKLGETDIVFTTSSSWSSLTELYIYIYIKSIRNNGFEYAHVISIPYND